MERLVEFIEVPIDLRIGIVLLLNLLQQLRRQIDTACRSPGREGLTSVRRLSTLVTQMHLVHLVHSMSMC